jgi:hypothetical protein
MKSQPRETVFETFMRGITPPITDAAKPAAPDANMSQDTPRARYLSSEGVGRNHKYDQ